MLDEVLESFKKMISADIETDVKEEIKELSHNFSQKFR